MVGLGLFGTIKFSTWLEGHVLHLRFVINVEQDGTDGWARYRIPFPLEGLVNRVVVDTDDTGGSQSHALKLIDEYGGDVLMGQPLGASGANFMGVPTSRPSAGQRPVPLLGDYMVEYWETWVSATRTHRAQIDVLRDWRPYYQGLVGGR